MIAAELFGHLSGALTDHISGSGGGWAGLDLRTPEYTIWWGIAGLILPVAFVSLLVILLRTMTRGGRARLPVDSRGAITVVGHLLRPDQSLTAERLESPSFHGVLVMSRGTVRWHYDNRAGWQAPAGVLLVTGVRSGLDDAVSSSVEFYIGGTGEWSGGWRMVIGGEEPPLPMRSVRGRARRRADAVLAPQLAAALIAQGAFDARRDGPRAGDVRND